MGVLAKPGEQILIPAQSKLGETNLYPQAKIKDSEGDTLATINLTHDANGAYVGTTTAPSAEGHYFIQTIIYTDEARTAQSGVDEIGLIILDVRHRSSGSGGGGAVFGGVSSKEIQKLFKPLAERIENLEKLLAKKSEFDPTKDKVQINQEIPKISDLISSIQRINNDNKPKDIYPNLLEIKKLIQQLPQSLPVSDIVNSISMKLDEVKSFVDSKIKPIDLSSIISEIDNIKDSQKLDTVKLLNKFEQINLEGIDLSIIKDIKQLELMSKMANKVGVDGMEEMIKSQSDNILSKINIKMAEDIDTTRKFIVTSRDQIMGMMDLKIKALDKIDAKRLEIVRREIKNLFSNILNELKNANTKEEMQNILEVLLNGISSKLINFNNVEV